MNNREQKQRVMQLAAQELKDLVKSGTDPSIDSQQNRTNNKADMETGD